MHKLSIVLTIIDCIIYCIDVLCVVTFDLNSN